MSRNRVPAHQLSCVQTSARQRRCQWINIIPALLLALGLGGCALNSLGLPSGLPVPPGGGTLTISRTTLVNGILGRTYTIWVPTSGGTGTLAAGGCTIIAGGLPTGLSIAPSNDLPTTAAVSFCKITGTITAGGGTTVNFTVQAADTATPSNTASQAFSITVRTDFAVTTATAFLNGVDGRTYGNPAELPVAKTPQPVVTDVSATVGNAPLTVCTFTFTAAGNPGFLPASLSPTPVATGAVLDTCPLSSGAAALSATGGGAFAVSLAATDSPITDPFSTAPFSQFGKIVVPAATKNTAAPLALTVNAALGLALTQATNATPTTALLNAVQGRSYGVIGGIPTYAATGGLTTTGNYNWCVSASPLPAGFATGPVAVSTNCAAPTAIATATSVTVTSATAGAAGGPTPFTLLAGDTGNAAVSGVTSPTTVGAVSNTAATNLTINALLSLAVNLADPLPDAVNGRTYGGAGFTSIIYTASSGDGAYTFTPPPTGAAPAAGVYPAPMACVAAATTLTCSSAAVTGTAGAYASAPASVDDAGNTAVPGSAAVAATATQTRTLNVRDVLSFLPTNYPNPLPTAVNARTWGTGAGFTPLIYTSQNGLGGYSFAISGTAFPTGIACATAAATFTCDTTVAGSVTGAAGPYNGILVNADDTANATTPSASASTTQPAAVSRDITVNAALVVALNALSPDPANANARAVLGRSYGFAPQAPVVYDVTGGLPAYIITSSGTLLTDTNIACPAGATSATCSSAVGVTKSTAGTGATLTVSATDTANSATPSGAASSGVQPFTIEALLAIAANFNDPMPDAVEGRTYGGPGFTSLVYTASNGLGGYTFTLPGNSPVPVAAFFPAPMACVAGVTTAICSSAAITGTPGNYTIVPASVDDTGNLTTPGSVVALATATVTRDLNVRPEFTITTVGPFLDGVAGRTYGNAPQSSQPVDTDVSATVGNAPLTSCTFTVAGNPGFNLTPAPGAASCPLSSGATTLTPAGPYSVSVSILDTAIIDPVSSGTVVPPGTVSNSGAPLALTVNAALAVALQVGSPDPTTAAGQAVVGRTYGAPTATDVVYEVTGGLPAYVITSSGTLTTDTNIACVSGATTSTCNSVNTAVTNTGGTNPDLTVAATDTANGATPAGAASTGSLVWTVNPPISFSLAPAATGVGTTGTIPDGVVGRTYGTPLADLVFTATGGLANAAGIGLQGTQTGTLAANGIVCNPSTPQVGASVTVTCNSAIVTTPSGVGRTLLMTFGDAGNSTTPADSTFTDNAGYTDYINNIADVLAIALQALSPDPANVNAEAVVGRTYGAAPESPVVYEATNGLPAYTFVRSGTLLVNSNICGTQNVTATTLICDSNGVGVTGTTGVLTVTVNDTGTATTPSGSDFLTTTYTVNPAVTLAVTPDPAAASSTAVLGRLYGAPAGLLSPTYTASGGLSTYAFVHSGTLEANTNIVCTDAATTVTCEEGTTGVTAAGPFPQVEPFTLQVTDGGNTTTPADPVGDTLTKNFTINDALTITNVSLINALLDFTYAPTGAGAPGEILTATGGLGGNTWVPGGTTVGACAPTGTFPPGLTLGAASGLLSGIATVESSTPTDYTFEVCVFDTANTTTPSGTPVALPTYLLNVMSPSAAAAAPGTDTLEVINTKTNTFVTSVALTAGDIPTSIAVTPNGRKAYVTLNGADDVAVIDTLDGTVTNIGGLGACTGPQGIAIGLVGGLPTAFVACSNRRIAVIDASTDTFVSSNLYGTAGGSFYGVAMNSPTDTLVYVTDSTNDEIVVLDALTATEIVGSPFGAGVTAPHGVVISANGSRVYIAGSGSDDVIVLSAATFTVVAGPISTGAGSGPEALAVTPDALGAHVYVTLTGADAFAVFDDTLATPAIIGAPVLLTAASSPFGVTIPPLLSVPVTGVRVYIAQFSLSNVSIRDDETVTPFGANAASPIALTATSTPMGIGHIPVPR